MVELMLFIMYAGGLLILLGFAGFIVWLIEHLQEVKHGKNERTTYRNGRGL